MGIRGLTKALKRRAGELQPEILPVDATLVVDGDGWAFEMINRVRDFMHGGNYLSLHEEVCREVQNLLGMGLQLVFYFGGGSDDFKSGTKLKRTRDREEEWMNAYAMCRERKLDPLLSLPIAPMGIIQVVATLEEIGMCIVRCNEEADQPIARKVRDHNQQDGKETYFCYGRDR